MGMFRQLMGTGAHRRDPLHGIHYVCDFDAKGRSNDEDEPMRSTWTDRATGKMIDLHNFSFGGGSGWNGYAQDFRADWIMNSVYGRIVNDHTASIDKLSKTVQFYQYMQAGESMDMRIRITGLSRNISEGKARQMRIYSRLQSEPNITVTEDGVYAIHAVYDADDSLYFYIPGTTGEELVTPVTIEQLPLYPGALVFDGVDDYGATREAVTEQVGTVLIMGRIVGDTGADTQTLMSCMETAGGKRIYVSFVRANDRVQVGNGFSPAIINNILTGLSLSTHGRVPEAAGSKLYVGRAGDSGFPNYSNYALCRLILIREQLTDEQARLLKERVLAEHNAWLADNGYDDYIEDIAI